MMTISSDLGDCLACGQSMIVFFIAFVPTESVTILYEQQEDQNRTYSQLQRSSLLFSNLIDSSARLLRRS